VSILSGEDQKKQLAFCSFLANFSQLLLASYNGVRAFEVHLMKLILILLIFISSVIDACPSASGERITVGGTVELITYPGPPNYVSIESGDAIESYWMLKFEHPMCFAPDGTFFEKELSLDTLQLLLHPLKSKVPLKAGVQYIASGITVPAVSAHHKTKVMLELTSIKEKL
jgi:hypothetical protein